MEPFPCHEFGGLLLRDAPDEVGHTNAIDVLNVDFDRSGAVRTRDGYDNFTSSTLTNNVASLHPYYTTSGTRQLLAGCGTRLEAISTGGAVVASASGLTTGRWDFARFGEPGAEVAYAVNGANRPHKWNGSAWSTASGFSANARPKYVEVMAVDQGNRMVSAGYPDSATGNPNGGQSYTSQVWFSDPGLPETHDNDNFQQLTPGDGETIQNIIAWREFVIVFKESRFFVFYGTSTDSDGNPVFNYRTVDTGVGLAAPKGVAIAPEGVYFLARDGIYLTVGGDPARISDDVRPLWTRNPWDFYAGGTITPDQIANAALHYHDGRLYLAYAHTTDNNWMAVHDPAEGWWSVWNIAATCLASFRIDNPIELVFGYPGATNHIGRHSSAYTTDDGAAIVSRWRSGFFDCGIEEEKKIKRSQVWGTGTVSMQLSDDYGSLDSGTSLTLGVSPAISTAYRNRDKQGTLFSHRLSSETNAWTVHRLTHYLESSRVTGTRTTNA